MDHSKHGMLLIATCATIPLAFYTVYFLILETSSWPSGGIYFLSDDALCFFRQYIKESSGSNMARYMSCLLIFTDIVFVSVCASQLMLSGDAEAEQYVCRDGSLCITPATMACIFTMPLLCNVVGFLHSIIYTPKRFIEFLESTDNSTLCPRNIHIADYEAARASTELLYIHPTIVYSVLLIAVLCVGVYVFYRINSHIAHR